MRDIGALLRLAAETDPDLPAFVEPAGRTTYAEWDARSDRAAARFVAAGLRPGDVVALLMPSGARYAIAYAGAAKAGLVTAGINPRFGARAIAHVLASSGARLLVAADEAEGVRLRALAESVRPPSLETVLAPGELDAGGAFDPREPAPDTPVAIVSTSGTTGLPKGAVYTAGALDGVRRIEMSLEPEARPVTLGAIPFPHMAFMTKVAFHIERRACIVMLERWAARAALEAIERERITHIGGVPTQLALMLMDPDFGRFDLSSLRQAAVGGAPASPELIRRIREGFGVPVTHRYSCTELGMATSTRAGDPDEVVANTVGRPLPEIELRVTDARGAPVAPGEVGEIRVRSPVMFAGYRRDEAQTRAALDGDGFFRTGDLGCVRPDGNLRLVGRLKEMYIRGGYNVYPAEVEAALREHPGVETAAVVGIPDDVLGERGAAFVVAREGAPAPDAAELRAFVAERLADYKVPDVIEVRDALPLTPMFKVDKQALREDAARA